MPLWSAAALVQATNGRMGNPFAAQGVAIDSRTLHPGDLFVALVGPRRDGHGFVADALARGAGGAMVSRVPGDLPASAALLVVPDTLAGLWKLGAFARARTQARVAAITGSVGKTTTKEMLRRILAARGATYAAKASYNNQWGVPLTLASIPADGAYAVVEVGTNHPGEIAPLGLLARPHVALITAIAKAHIGAFGSLSAIADEKASLFAAIEAGGTAILPRDSSEFARLLARVPHGCRVLTFGADPHAEARLLAVEEGTPTSTVRVAIEGRALEFRLGTSGRHLALDATAALAAAHALGLDPGEAARALAGFTALPGRGVHRRLALKGGEALLIDESYNASGASMRAAFAVLARQRGRRVAVLGDMLELGREAEAEHVSLAAPLGAASDLVFACGPMMRLLFARVPPALRGGYAATAEALAPVVAEALAPGDVVLVKGSLGSHMRCIVDELTEGARATEREG